MIMTSNRGFGEWGDIFGDSVVATALLDRLLHHAVVIPIEGNSYPSARARELAAGALAQPRGAATLNDNAAQTRPRSSTQGGRRKHHRPSTGNATGWGNLLRWNWGKVVRC